MRPSYFRFSLLSYRIPLVIAGLLWQYTGAPTGSMAEEPAPTRAYHHKLQLVDQPRPILADFPRYVAALPTVRRFRAPVLVDDPGADLELDAWRFSYNLKAVVEVPCRLRLDRTAVLVVHPWAIDDGQGLTTPEPAGVAFAGFKERNLLCHAQLREVVSPFLKQLRGRAKVIGYSLPGKEDPIRKKLYRSVRSKPSEADQKAGRAELAATFKSFNFHREEVPETFDVSTETPVRDYFKQVPGIDAYDRYNGPGFWQMPMPLSSGLSAGADDFVFYDGEGYPLMRDFLKEQGVRHVLLTGFHADMCVCSTMAGFQNLRQDFDVFFIGDMTQGTYPAAADPQQATTTAVAKASLEVMITQRSWIKLPPQTTAK